MARNKLAKKTPNEEAGTVTFEFTDGRTITVNVNDLPDNVRNIATLHGVSQKVGDSYAGAETVDEAYEAATDVVKNLQEGNWRVRAEGGVGGAARATMLVEALFRATAAEGNPKTMDECEELIADMSDEQRKGLRNMPQIKAHLDKIAAERAIERAERSAKNAANKPLDLSALGV